jgi:hypothetical protein
LIKISSCLFPFADSPALLLRYHFPVSFLPSALKRRCALRQQMTTLRLRFYAKAKPLLMAKCKTTSKSFCLPFLAAFSREMLSRD